MDTAADAWAFFRINSCSCTQTLGQPGCLIWNSISLIADCETMWHSGACVPDFSRGLLLAINHYPRERLQSIASEMTCTCTWECFITREWWVRKSNNRSVRNDNESPAGLYLRMCTTGEEADHSALLRSCNWNWNHPWCGSFFYLPNFTFLLLLWEFHTIP